MGYDISIWLAFSRVTVVLSLQIFWAMSTADEKDEQET